MGIFSTIKHIFEAETAKRNHEVIKQIEERKETGKKSKEVKLTKKVKPKKSKEVKLTKKVKPVKLTINGLSPKEYDKQILGKK